MIRLEFSFSKLFFKLQKQYLFMVEKFEGDRNLKKQVSCGQYVGELTLAVLSGKRPGKGSEQAGPGGSGVLYE